MRGDRIGHGRLPKRWVSYGKILQMEMEVILICHDRRYLKQYEVNGMVGIGVIYSNVPYQVKRCVQF